MAGMSQRPLLPAGALYTRDAQIAGFAITTLDRDLAGAAARINRLVARGAPPRVEQLPLTRPERRISVLRWAQPVFVVLGPASTAGVPQVATGRKNQ